MSGLEGRDPYDDYLTINKELEELNKSRTYNNILPVSREPTESTESTESIESRESKFLTLNDQIKLNHYNYLSLIWLQ